MKKILFALLIFFGKNLYSQFETYTVPQIEIESNLNYSDFNKLIKENSDSTYRIQIVSKSSKPIMVGNIKSLNPEIKDGNFYFYSPNNIVAAKGMCMDDIPVGKWSYFEDDGSIDKILNYNRALQFLKDRTNIILNDDVLFLVEAMPHYEGGDINNF